MRRRAWAGYLLAGVACAGAYAAAGSQPVEEAWWQVVTFGSAGAVALGTRLHRPSARRPWWLVFISLATFAVMGLLGMSVWGWPTGHVIWPLRDLGLVAGFVVLGLATLSLAHARAPDGDPEGAIDGLIVMIAMAAVLWDTVFATIVRGGTSNVAEVVRFILFPVLQAGVTAAALRLLFLGTVRNPSAWLVFGASCAACAGNVTWVVQGGGAPRLGVNLLWIASFLLAGTAALHPAMRHIATPAAPATSTLPFGRLAVLGIALVSLPVTVVREMLVGGGVVDAPAISAGAAVVCAGLVLWRLGRLVHQREQAAAALGRRAAREAALARISGRALIEADVQTVLAEATADVRSVLDALACDVLTDRDVSTAGDGSCVVVPLADWSTERAVLVVRLPAGRQLDVGEQEFLQATSNVLVSAIRRCTAERELRHQSLHDPLTGLPNRVLLLDRLDQALARSARTRRPVSVLFVDLDGFKHVNDTLGHNAGDELLAIAAHRMRSLSRPRDTLARLSGDEFVMVCDETDGPTAVAVAERLVGDLARSFDVTAGTVAVGASLGVVSAIGDTRRGEQLLREADAAMYQAKQAGRGRVQVFDDALRARLARLDEVERDLRGAAERGELRLVYQPILALGGDHVIGAEALLRWDHPRHGLVLPTELIAVAEARGLIGALGDWVIATACRQAFDWRARVGAGTDLTMAINVSVRQLAEAGFARRFCLLLDASGASARDVVVEVTETALAEPGQDTPRVARALHELRDAGVRVALDDFGTGYSSLSHLRSLPLDVLKVDGSFVAGLGQPGREHAIVSAVAGLTQELGVTVLAEGVETPEQLIAVRTLGFDLAQGFHLGRPGEASEVERRLQGAAAHART